jgi:hypothetical protein
VDKIAERVQTLGGDRGRRPAPRGGDHQGAAAPQRLRGGPGDAVAAARGARAAPQRRARRGGPGRRPRG